MNKTLIKNSIKVCKLLEHFYNLDKVHVYVDKEIDLFAYQLFVTYNEFRGRQKMFCIDAEHYIKYKNKYSDLANFNIALVCEEFVENDIVIDKSEIFSKHLIKIILKINFKNDDKRLETFNEWKFIRDNIFQRRFNNYKKRINVIYK